MVKQSEHLFILEFKSFYTRKYVMSKKNYMTRPRHSNIFLALSVYLRENNFILSRLKYAILSKELLKAGSMGANALISYLSDFWPNLPGSPTF